MAIFAIFANPEWHADTNLSNNGNILPIKLDEIPCLHSIGDTI